jgi:hypothetical protein
LPFLVLPLVGLAVASGQIVNFWIGLFKQEVFNCGWVKLFQEWIDPVRLLVL